MKNIEIFDMTYQDYEQIEAKLISDFDDFWTPSILKAELMGENKTYLVAKNNMEIVGFAGFMIVDREIEIMNIVTKKSERSKGIGKMLLDKIIEMAQNKKIERIFLEVNEKNLVAIKLYEKSGFTEIGRRKKYYHSTDDAMIMSKKLNNL